MLQQHCWWFCITWWWSLSTRSVSTKSLKHDQSIYVWNFTNLSFCRSIKKLEFEEKTNDVLKPEPFVTCKDCLRKLHQVCVLHNDHIWKDGFVCDSCHKHRGTKKTENSFTAEGLPTTHLSTSIETRVNNFLRRKKAESGKVHIRVVFSGDKTVEVKEGMKRWYDLFFS